MSDGGDVGEKWKNIYTGDTVQYTNWASNQPNNNGGMKLH